MSGTSLGVLVGGSAVSTREVSLPPIFAGEGGSLVFPQRLLGIFHHVRL